MMSEKNEVNTEIDLEVDQGEQAPEVAPDMEISENKGLDQFVDEATKTKSQEQTEQKQSAQVEKEPEMTAEEAGVIAVTGLMGVAEMVGESTGKEIAISQPALIAVSALVSPAIMKYGSTVKKLLANPGGINQDSWWPEVMALAGVGVGGMVIYKQAAVDLDDDQGASDADKPQ